MPETDSPPGHRSHRPILRAAALRPARPAQHGHFLGAQCSDRAQPRGTGVGAVYLRAALGLDRSP